MVHHQDEPIADWVCVPLYYVSKLARDSGTIVVQVGEGSDELFHGYQNYIDAVARAPALLGAVPARSRHRCAGSCAAPRSALARRTGRGVLHAQYVADAAAGRLPFWGGAICYTGELKRQILAGNGSRPDAYRVVQRLWDEAERDAPRRRPAPEDDLPRAQAAPRRAAADARGQDDDGDLRRGARAVPGSRARRVRPRAAARR